MNKIFLLKFDGHNYSRYRHNIMESIHITSPITKIEIKNDDMTIVSIIKELKQDFAALTEEERVDWNTIWELIQIIMTEVGFERYCIEPFIRDIYDRITLEKKDTLDHDKETLELLKTLELPEQRTPEWFKFRQTRLTASELSYCITNDITSSISQKIMLQKIHPEAVPYISSPATSHGTLFEPVAQYVYERIYNRKLFEFGCVPHKKVDWLAASPDGISEDGIMVEIKCPYSRTPKGVPSLTYYTQIQAQQEVCDLEWCDFMECLIESYDDRVEYIKDTAVKGDNKVKQILRNKYYRNTRREYLPKKGILKGVALVIESSKGPKYEVISWDEMEKMGSKEWINETLKRYYEDASLSVTGYVLKHWILKEVWITRVQRNRDWFMSILPKAKAFWDELEKRKEEGIEVPKKKTMEFVEEVL